MSTQADRPLPSLRHDVDIVVDPSSSAGGYLLRDSASHRVWQIGEREKLAAGLLDGSRSLSEIVQTLRSQHPSRPEVVSTTGELSEFFRQLGHEGLLSAPYVPASASWQEIAGNMAWRLVTFPFRAVLRWLVVAPWDVLSLGARPGIMRPRHLRFGNPDRLVVMLSRLARPVIGRAGLAAALAYGALGIVLLIGHFDAWRESVALLWTPAGAIVVGLIGVLAVHVPHQFSHGVVLAHYGARVPSWGIRTVLNIIPAFWLDINDLLWLPEKQWRMSALAAGILWQSFAMTTGLIGWLIAVPGSFPSIAFLALSSTAAFGFVMNANPLVRRDGYQLLSTWLEIPDLRERATTHLRSWVRWQATPEPLTRRERRWFGAYSAAANAFGLVLSIVALVFALRVTDAYGESGAVSVFLVGGLIFQDHLRSVFQATGVTKVGRWLPRSVSWALRLAVLGVIIWALFLRYPYHAGGDTTLIAIELAEVRTELEGLIGEVQVREGDWVEEGQTLATLLTHVQESNLYAAEAELAEARARQSALLSGARPEEIERARATVMTAEAQLEWSRTRADRFKPLFEQKIIGIQEYENAMQAQRIDERRVDEARAALAVVESGTRVEALDAAEAGIRSQQAVVAHFRGNMQRTALLSPISGFVTTPQIEHLQGLYVMPGQRDLVATIENTKVLIAAIEIPEEDVAGVSVGTKVTLYTWSYPEQPFEGVVASIAPTATDETPSQIMVRVQTEIANPDGLLKPKMTGYAKIEIEERPVWDILFRPALRWIRIEVWSWLP